MNELQDGTDSAPEPLLTVPEVSRYLRVSEQTLWQWRKDGDGPPFIRVGKSDGTTGRAGRPQIRYRRHEVEQFLTERTERP